ncbi:cyclic nucleotide-binding protein [Taibaiella sp. KBW10]|uniref:Crp/Fnr family transcriptional regulator n=1 Tax=Taibaiella sp. KBW10 TaxID=2153357 RepID=UPI000F5A1077|nr:Crp/Fnr family transcriptional regulator [Taibaiella sp. KBW10]RQO30656.1 cyclic nucleotide-binding protein [Taibaiella sp. KBW10]
MTPLVQYLESHFDITAPDDLQQISGLFKTVTLKKGDYWLKTDQYCRQLSFVKSGLLRIYRSVEDKEVTQWISAEGSFLTDLSGFLFQTPSRWNIQALTEVSLYTISQTDYQKLGTLVEKWHTLEKQFIAKCFTMLENRMFQHLSMSAEERYISFFEQHKALFHQVPLQYIASMLGMTPETFSRIRKKQML